MKKFDTNIQEIKYHVLREVAKRAWQGNLEQTLLEIPKTIVPGTKPTMRCCVYLERAILAERVQLAICRNHLDKSVVQVIDIACDDCPMGGYEITNSCRGCIAHRCETVCKFGAITFDQHQKAHIDKEKCRECGQCAKVCPYSAIVNHKRPCEIACKVGAISVNQEHTAQIDEDKCISCGACVYQCPFGAITDRSYILDAVDLLKQKEHKVYAVVAPSIAGQFTYAQPEQVIAGLYQLGIYHVVEAALGADLVAYHEAEELTEKSFLTSSCCPAFVEYIHKSFPQLRQHISSHLSPAAVTAQLVKNTDPNAKVIFIGPCLAKKKEYSQEHLRSLIDCTLTFEELQALLDSRNIDISQLTPAPLNNASFYGRLFARSGGLSAAVKQAIAERNLHMDSPFSPAICSGLEECRRALLKADKNKLKENFIEGMACEDGCIGGAGCLTHGPKNKKQVDDYGREALERQILDSVQLSNLTQKQAE